MARRVVEAGRGVSLGGLVAVLVLAAVAVAVLPLLAPAAGLALLAVGLTARRTADQRQRTVATAVAVLGAMLVVVSVVVLIGGITVDSGGDEVS
jgi:hypothetical protein